MPLTRFLRYLVLAAPLLALAPAAHADDMATIQAQILKGDLRGAQLTLRKLVSQDPQNAEAHYWLGRVSFDLGDPVAAEREAGAAQARGYDPTPTIRLLGQALLAQGKYDLVLNTLQPSGSDAGFKAAVQLLRGYAMLGQNKPDAATAAFADAERLAPNAMEPPLAQSRLALLRNDLPTAQARLDRALSLQPKAPEALLAKAQLRRMQGHPQDAVAVLDNMLLGQLSLPDMVQARLDRASLEIPLGQLPAAKLDIDAVLAVTPANVQALYLQAALAAQGKDYGVADARLERIGGYLDRIPRAYLLVAMVKEQLGQLEQADTAAHRYLAKAPNDIAGYDIAARILFDKRRPDLVIKTLLPLVASGKADKGSYEMLGGAYAATGQPQQALEAYQHALLLAPDDVAIQTSLASLRVGTGQPVIAVTDLEHALARQPHRVRIGDALFFAALATGDVDATARALARIKTAQGDTAQTRHMEGLLQQARLDIDGAKQTFAAIIAKYPDFQPARISLAHLLAVEGHTEQSDKLLSGILERQPAAEPALTLLVGDAMQSNRPSDAIALLQRARAAEPGNLQHTLALGGIFVGTGTPQKALDLIGQLSGEQRSRVEVMNLKAAAELALGQQQAARDTLVLLLRQNPTDLGARRRLVGLLADQHEYETARIVLRDGMAATPRSYPLLLDDVTLELQARGPDAALAAADLLQSQDREFPLARLLRGDVLVAANRPDDGIAAYAAALQAAPVTAVLLRLVGTQVRFGHIEAARASLQQWLSTHSADVPARQQLAQLDIVTKRLDEAAENLRMILDERPHDPVALNNLAWVYQQQNDPRCAELARQAYSLAPNAQNTDTLGWILTNAGYADLGALLLHQADVESRGDPRMRYHYAVALRALGQRDEAIRLLSSIVTGKRDFPEREEAAELLTALRRGS